VVGRSGKDAATTQETAVLSAIAVASAVFFVERQAFEEVTDKRCDLVSRFVQREMLSFQHVDFSFRHVAGIGRRAGDGEGGIVLAPNHQGRRLYRAKPVLPARIGGDVGPVVQKQRGLNIGLARMGEKGVLVGPRIRIVTIGMGAAI